MIHHHKLPLLLPKAAAEPPAAPSARILILTVKHGAGHLRVARALRLSLLLLDPGVTVCLLNATQNCRFWFRLYYDSYQIFLRYWPTLWSRIEGLQHESQATGPAWLYRRGAAPLFRFIGEFNPDTVIATEVGMCELAAMLKREAGARFNLAALPGLDVDRAWVQPEVDLYVIHPGEPLRQLLVAGAPGGKIVDSGMPLDPAFSQRLPRAAARQRLGIDASVPLFLVLFGGAGYGKPERILPALRSQRHPFKAVLIAGENRELEQTLRKMCAGDPHLRALGWVNNMREWMAAADVLVGKPGEGTLIEALNARLPVVAFDPLPGAEERLCGWIERERVGAWARSPEQLGALLARLLQNRGELAFMRRHAARHVAPNAARNGAQAILSLHNPGYASEGGWVASRPLTAS